MVIPPAVIGAMSSNRVILGELLSSRARPRFPGQPQPATSTPVRHHKCTERHTGTSCTVSLQGVTPLCTTQPTGCASKTAEIYKNHSGLASESFTRAARVARVTLDTQ